MTSSPAAGLSLSLEAVTVDYGKTTALRDLSLTVEPGEFFCVLGPSGCGKSTMLNVVAGFLPLRTGRILLGGQDVTALPPQRRGIGVVFQSYALYPHMTVEQNVGYGLKVRGQPSAVIARRVAEMLELVHLGQKGERYPRQLSGGEQQRVAIARALAIEPRLLLLDEPLSNLDARLRDDMRVELKRIQRSTGVTTIFVTHDQAEAFGLGDRVAVLNAGRLDQVGLPRDIYRRPRSAFVADFVGRSNVIRGTINADEPQVLHAQGHRFTTPGGDMPKPAKLILRPEEVHFVTADAPGQAMAGSVVDVSYGGTLVTYRVQTVLGDFELCRLGIERETPEIGDVVRIGWPVDAGYLLPDGDDG